jgi:hypothetical protein
MRTILAAIALFLMSLSPSMGQNEKAFGLCQKKALHGGETLYLSANKHKTCWKVWRGGIINYSDLKAIPDTNRFGFVYVFGDSSLKDDSFDPIFNVKIKEISNVSTDRPKIVTVLRDEIVTRCKSFFGLNKGEKRNRKVIEEVDAQIYNRFHSRGSPDEPSISSLHIPFLNSNDVCDRTDSKQLRKLFVLDSEEIARPKDNSEAIADPLRATAYKKISVRIGEGRFRNGLFSASFYIQKGPEYNLVVNDLSTYIDRSLRDTLNIEIRK